MTTSAPGRLQLNRRFVVSNMTALFSGSVVAQGLTAVTLLLTARQLGPATFGQYAGSFALVSFTTILFNLGLDIWLLREGGRTPDRLHERAGSVLAIKFLLGILWVGAWAMIAPMLRLTSFPPELLPLAALTAWLDRLFLTLSTVFKAALKNRVTFLLESVADGVWFLGTLWLIGQGQGSAESFFWVRIGALVGAFVLGIGLAARVVRLSVKREVVQGALRASLPYATSDFLTWIYLRADVLIIGFALSDEAVGIYSPAVSLANALYLVPGAIHAVLIPVLSNLFAHHPAQAWRTAWRSVGLLTGIGLAMTVGTFVIARFVVGLLGSQYANSVAVLQILSLNLLIHSISFGLAAMIVALNLQGKRSIVQAVAVVVNVGLNLLVVRAWGVNGVAAVYVITEVVLFAGYLGIVFRHYRRGQVELKE